MADALDPYRAKRDFGATAEPAGGDSAPGPGDGGGAAPRFVVQEHSATRLHWDLRLEHDGVLASWALPRGVPYAPKDNRMAVRTEDHPLEYLTFAGEIPAGEYGAGRMTVWDTGTYEELKWAPDKVEVLLHGERLRGRWALFAMGEDRWGIHRMDPPQDPGREPVPDRIPPMLATAADLPEGEGWAFEVKWDGIRAGATWTPGHLRLASRNGLDITDRYPELTPGARALGMHEAVLDGEIVALDAAGRPSFSALQQRMHGGKPAAVRRLAAQTPVTYVVFDLLWLDGHSLMDRPYDERRAALAALGLASARWLVPEPLAGDGPAVLAATREHGLEGVVAKRRDAPYAPGRRSRAWVKVRHRQAQDLVIGGWLPEKAASGRRSRRVGALLVGVPEDGGLRFAGRVGSGLTEEDRTGLAARLGGGDPPEEDPFTAGPARPREAVFCPPHLAAEVAFAEWTPDGLLRQPVFRGLREHQEPDAVVGPVRREGRRSVADVQVGERTIAFANPDKVMFPEAGLTKRDLLAYALDVAPVMLPHLAGRALTVRRWPDGVGAPGFYEKHRPAGTPEWVRTHELPSGRSGTIVSVVCDDAPTLAWLVNLAAIELHVPLARVSAPGVPTAVVFDLDPGAPAALPECCRVALLIQGMLEGLGLRSVAKTSGSKGLQVYVPLNDPAATFAATKTFSRAVARTLTQNEPGLVVDRQAKAIREGRVLVDWSQNDEHKTTVAAYSPRALEPPGISTPVTWDEVARCARDGDPVPLRHGPASVRARVAEHGDLFAALLTEVQRLPGG